MFQFSPYADAFAEFRAVRTIYGVERFDTFFIRAFDLAFYVAFRRWLHANRP